MRQARHGPLHFDLQVLHPLFDRAFHLRILRFDGFLEKNDFLFWGDQLSDFVCFVFEFQFINAFNTLTDMRLYQERVFSLREDFEQ